MLFPRLIETELIKLIEAPRNVLLLGPRQTGKSTLIENLLKNTKRKTITYKLQNIKTFNTLIKAPETIAQKIELELETEKSINLFIDEVQKIPILLNDCQYLIDKYKKRICVILSGSSAKKLRSQGTNLLPGRVFVKHLHSLCIPEIMKQEVQRILPIKGLSSSSKKIPLTEFLINGTLPGILSEKPDLRTDLLESYVDIYLQEEIKAEALTRNLGAFSKFLELSALESGSTPNLTKISQDSSVPISTVKNYFQLLQDTLITYSIPPFTKKSRKQILTTPKYVYFDIGVRNHASEEIINKQTLKTETGGKIFEQFICLELIKRIQYYYPKWKYFYWRTNNGLEVDFIIQSDKEIIPIEIKHAKTPHKRHIKHLQIFMDEYKCKRGYVIGDFNEALKLTDKVYAIPWNEI